MADKKISQLTTLAQADVAVTADFLPIVDTSATETKKATPQALVQAGATGATLPVALGAVGTPSYTFTGDLNTGLWSPAADTLAASTGGSERLRVDSSGNVGIGTASPTGKLSIKQGAAQIDVTTGANDVTLEAIDRANTAASIDTKFYTRNGTFQWHNGSYTERMRLDSSGNLGIGTASPAGKVDSVSNATAAYAARASTTGANQTVNAVNAYNADASLFALAKYNAVQHIWGYSGTTEGMRLDSSGNLGIGTASPGARLHVAGESRFGLGAEAVRAAIGSAFAAGQGELFTTSTNSMGVGTAGAANLNFYSNSVLRMIIDSNGNVRTNTGALTTTATDGFLYVPTCAGTPTGTPTAITGMAPIVVNTTNNKLYFYSGGAWRDAGP